MRGDPNQCREQAAECGAPRERRHNPASRDDFIELANVWLKLAAQLESDRALLDMLDNAQTFGIRRFA
jgi:hypothetical protein